MITIRYPEDRAYYFSQNIPDFILQKEGGDDDTISFELNINGSNIFTEIYTFDTNGIIAIRDISSIVNKYLSYTDELPEQNHSLVTENRHTVASVTYVWGPESMPDNSETTYTAIYCNTDMRVDDVQYFLKKNFLTNLQRVKYTSISRKEYLSFFAFGSKDVYRIDVRLFLQQPSIVTELTAVYGMLYREGQGDKAVTFECSLARVLEALQLSNTDIVNVLHYDIWVECIDGETFYYRYMVDHEYYKTTNHLLFFNSFGMAETFTATGNTNTKSIAEYTFGNIQHTYRKLQQNYKKETTVLTGILTEIEMIWLDDLFMSSVVALYNAFTGIVDEYVITEIDKEEKTANEIQFASFTMRRAKNIHSVSLKSFGVFDNTFNPTFE